MKLLWVKSDFLHPTNRGGQIRTLEMLKRLHARHEVHYIALNAGNPEGVARSREYCSQAYAIDHDVPDRDSFAFTAQVLKGLISPLPIAVSRYKSERMRREIEELSRRHKFDAIVCDFLFTAPNIPDLGACILFQHNVEAVIWQRRARNARAPQHRFYFDLQARRMLAYEGQACRAAKSVVAVSPLDVELIRKQYSVQRVAAISTGVDIDYFAPRGQPSPRVDIIFVGSMDWTPNVDGATWFVQRVLPLLRRRRPNCSVSLVGRLPAPELMELVKSDAHIQVTGTAPDIREYLWGAAVSIVPLRIGSGTRLKIFESMAARVPVVSTAVGAEGLPVENGVHLYIADDPQDFADRCLELMDCESTREHLVEAAWDLVSSRHSWETVSSEFEQLLLC